MSIILSPYTPVSIRNPYSVLLEQEYDQSTDNTPTTTDILKHPGTLSRTISEDDIDRMSVSSWSVVSSAYGSDNENENDDEEIYTDASVHHLAPLTVSATGDDGFTTISKTMTATSINSISASTTQPDAWVVKITKKRQQLSRRKSKVPSAAAPSLADVTEGSEYSESEYGTDEEDGDFYGSMTEHELSKSSKAVKLKNIRLASAHDIELFKVLNRGEVAAKLSTRPPKIVSQKSKERSRVRSINLD
ncbi:hypothetical protein BGX28_007017 [Mortierella sp. GBA30]|nr:hypothetical protein BGX28_007017 [Mortierella sp. GBA30]